MNKEQQNTKQLADHFIEQMGMISQGDGLPRISGKVFGLLLVESGPFSFGDIANRLEVSRGSISTNTRLLENLGIIERVSKFGERGDFFQLAQDPYSKLLQGVMQRMTKALSTVKEARSTLPESWSVSQKRLGDLETFYAEYVKNTKQLVEKLSKV
jgi:DNA-binding transcriptional regulator GbsR (MarR family)